MPSYLSYMRQMAVLDADDNEIESWITVRGNHIPIKKGQSKEDAVKSFIESKGGKYKKESYGKHYVKTGEKGDEKYVDPRTDTLHREKSKVGFFGSEKEAKEYAEKLNHTDPYAGTPFAVKNYTRTKFPYNVESEENEEKKEFATKYLKRAMNGVGKEKWGKMAYAEKTEAIKKEKDYYRTEGRNLYFDTEKGYGIRTDDPEFEKQFFEEYPDADKEDFKDYVKGFNGVGMTNKDTGSIIKQSKVEMTNGLKHITHTTPEGYKFSVWESSNDPGWKTNNLPADYFETEKEATEAATKQFEKDLEYYNSGKANKKGKQFFEEKYGTKKSESKK